jgi:hypothetical protein
VRVEGFRWDNLYIYYQPAIALEAALTPWFKHWFDQGGLRYDEGAEFAEIIHRLLIKPDHLCIDFGTAPAEAFWSLLGVLANAGVRDIRIDRNPRPS